MSYSYLYLINTQMNPGSPQAAVAEPDVAASMNRCMDARIFSVLE